MLADGLIERASSVLDETSIKNCTKKRTVIERAKRSKTQNEVKPAKNINKNPQKFLGISLLL